MAQRNVKLGIFLYFLENKTINFLEMIGQRKLVLIRKESKQVSVFISKEPKQSLGLGSKLVKVIQVKVDISKGGTLFIHTF